MIEVHVFLLRQVLAGVQELIAAHKRFSAGDGYSKLLDLRHLCIMENIDGLIVNERVWRKPSERSGNIGRPVQMAGVMGNGRTAMERLSKAAAAAGFAMATEDDQPAPLARAGDMVVASTGTAVAVRNAPDEQAPGWSATLKEWLPTSLTRGATA